MTPEWNQTLNTIVSSVRVDDETTDEDLVRFIPFDDMRSDAKGLRDALRLAAVRQSPNREGYVNHFHLHFTGKVVMLIADMGPECQLAMANEHGSGQDRSMRLINNGPYTPEDVLTYWQASPGTRQ